MSTIYKLFLMYTRSMKSVLEYFGLLILNSWNNIFPIRCALTPNVVAHYARGMRWPYYGWIIYGYTSPDHTKFPACIGSFSYLEGTVFPTYYTYPTTKASLEDTAFGLLYKASAQATLLNTDLKTALLRLPVPGIQPNLTFHYIQNNTPAVYFLQVRNGTATRVATVLNGTVAENQWLQEVQLPRGRLLSELTQSIPPG